MNQYLVEFDLPDSFTEQFISLIPEQRAQVQKLMRSGKLSNYALSLDRKKLWAFFRGENEQEIVNTINTFPLINYMHPTIHELMFHENVFLQFPVMSMN
ncbi:MAG: hypothetical protein JNJ85_10400 [Candidatus Kapabacteria bacterium]|nr:hypothetical protein [Candidatus Kapabacteria bacterium]MBX7154599.1 hypothetical protein [Bacteroidota bacterium]